LSEINLKPFRELDPQFLHDLKEGKLQSILEFERKHRKSFMVEIRKNFLDLYFLGHGIEVRKNKGRYYLKASKTFDPEPLLPDKLKKAVKYDDYNKWKIYFEDIEKEKDYNFNEIMTSIILKIVEYKKGDISEGVSEINHFIENRTIGEKGIFVIDSQVSYPGTGQKRIDLLGLRRINNGNFTFVVLELKNKNNSDIANVFTHQVKKYINIVYDLYEHF